jgi:hypothetical protein
MELVVFFLLIAAAGAYFTSIGCRRAHAQHRPPSWRSAWLATFVTVLLTVLLACQEDLFRPSRWDAGKVPIWFTVVWLSATACPIALLGSGVVLEIFWRKFKHESTAWSGHREDDDQSGSNSKVLVKKLK